MAIPARSAAPAGPQPSASPAGPQPSAPSELHCTSCGRAASECSGCARPLDPPRYCAICARRLRVVVTPGSWRATCPVGHERYAPQRQTIRPPSRESRADTPRPAQPRADASTTDDSTDAGKGRLTDRNTSSTT